MGTHLKQVFADLDKDPDSRIRCLNSLRNYAQQLDKKMIPQFIAQLSELPDGQLPREYLISLYEVIVREHGKSIIPQITKMMGDVLKALSSNAPSLALQQVCAKAVSAMARYTLDPSSFQGQREGVIRDLASPLIDVLLGTVQSLAEGAAVCLQVLVETEAWKYAPDDIVNEICLRVTGALEEKGTQTNSHMKLVCSLAKSNSPILEAYGRSLLKAAAKILETGVVTGNSQQRLHAVLMINGLLKFVDMDILASEIPNTVMYLEGCRSDRTPYVRKVVSETIQLAKALASEMSRDLNNDGSYSDEEIPCEGNRSSRGSFCGFNDFSPDTQIGPYTHSPVSSVQSLNTKYQTPITGSGTRARRSSNFDLSRGYYSDSIDENAFSRKMRNSSFSPWSDRSESTRPDAGKNMATEQTPHCFLTRRGKDGDSRTYLVSESRLFEKGGNRSISLENDIKFGSDTEIAAEYESDGASERKYSCEHVNRQTRTRMHMFDRHGENGDTLTCDGDHFERRRSYKEAENDPCLSFCINNAHCHCPSAVEKAAVSPKDPVSYITTDDMNVFNTPRRIVRSLKQHSSSENTCKKLQLRKEFADSAEVNYDNLNETDWTMNISPAASDTVDESRVGDHGQMMTAGKGRTVLDSLYSVADGYSVRSNSEEGDLPNSSEWSESVHRTGSLSPASSTVFEEILDNKGDYQSNCLTELDKGTHRTDDKKENCLPADVGSVEGSAESFKGQETNAFCTYWRRALRFMESIMGMSLCAVLAVPATMVVVKLCSMQEEYPVMVPT